MAEYFRVVIPAQKKVYKLGTFHSAINTFPLLLHREGAYKAFILYGDETHAFLQDKYEYDNVDGYEIVEYDGIPHEHQEWVEHHRYTESEFRVVFNEFGGQLVRKVNKFDFIKE